MATLTAQKQRQYGVGFDETFNDLPVAAAVTIEEGSAVGLAAGLARKLVAADKFVGFAVKEADNAAGAASAINVKVRRSGSVVVPVVGVVGVADISKIVYASDDDTFTLTAMGNSKIGHIIRWITGTTCEVFFTDQET